MSTFKNYPKGGPDNLKFGFRVVLPTTYTTAKKYMLWIIGHGIGECGDGSEAAINKAANWGNWAPTNGSVDKYDYIQIYINTAKGNTAEYREGEYVYAVDWAIKNLSIDEKQVWAVGHSLGWYGFGNWISTKPEWAKRFTGTVASSSGPIANVAATAKGIVDAGLKFWGVTSVNDGVVSWTILDNVWKKIKELKPDAAAYLTVFPTTEWPNKVDANGVAIKNQIAHNTTICRMLAQGWSGMFASRTKGLAANVTETTPMMNVYEWCLSNPMGSIPQAPSSKFSGPKWSTTPTPTVDKDAKIKELEGTVTSLNSTIVSIRKDVETLTAENVRKDGLLKANQDTINDLNTKLATASKESNEQIITLNSTIENRNKEITELKATISEQGTKIDVVTKSITDAGKALKIL